MNELRDSTLSILPSQSDLNDLKQKIDTLLKEITQADLIFRPFLPASVLNLLHQQLSRIETFNSSAYREVIVYVGELVTLQLQLKPHVSELLAPLTTTIISVQITIALKLISLIKEKEGPLDDALFDYNCLNVQMVKLAKNYSPTLFNNVFIALDDLYHHLDTLKRQPILEQEVENIEGLLVNELSAKNLAQIREELSTLRIQSQKINLTYLINKIDLITATTYTREASIIKQSLDIHIEAINAHRGEPIQDKRKKYSDLLLIIRNLANLLPLLTLSPVEKVTYLNHMRSGYDLCDEPEFLELMAVYVSKINPVNASLYLDYVKTSIKNNNLKKRKRTDTEHADDMNSQLNSKKTCSIPISETHSEQITKFINILAPIREGDKPLSRKFVTALLHQLAETIFASNDKKLHFKQRIIIAHNLSTTALTICPLEEKLLIENITQRINEFKSLDVSAFKTIEDSLRTHAHPTPTTSHEAMSSILSNLVEEISVYIDDDSLDNFIYNLGTRWLTAFAEKTPYTEKLTTLLMKQFNSQSAISVSSSSSELSMIAPPANYTELHLTTEPSNVQPILYNWFKKEFRNFNAQEFAAYLNDIKHRLSPEHYKQYLMQPNDSGKTPLHFQSSYCLDIFKIYVHEVRQLLNNDSFYSYLTLPCKNGYTPLHQMVRYSGINTVIYFTQLLKEVNSTSYPSELRKRCVSGYLPTPDKNNVDFHPIRNYLNNEKKQHPHNQPSFFQEGVPQEKLSSQNSRHSYEYRSSFHSSSRY